MENLGNDNNRIITTGERIFLDNMPETLALVGLKVKSGAEDNELEILGGILPISKKIEYTEFPRCNFRATVTLPDGRECHLDYSIDKSMTFHHNIKVGDYSLVADKFPQCEISNVTVSEKSEDDSKEKRISFSKDEGAYYYREGKRSRTLYRKGYGGAVEMYNIECGNGVEDDKSIGMTKVYYSDGVGEVLYKNGDYPYKYPIRTLALAETVIQGVLSTYRVKSFVRYLDADFEKAFPGIGNCYNDKFKDFYNMMHSEMGENPMITGVFNTTTRPECDMNENGFVMKLNEELTYN